MKTGKLNLITIDGMRKKFAEDWGRARRIWKDKIAKWLDIMKLNRAYFYILEFLGVYMNDSGSDVLAILTLIYPELAYLLIS